MLHSSTFLPFDILSATRGPTGGVLHSSTTIMINDTVEHEVSITVKIGPFILLSYLCLVIYWCPVISDLTVVWKLLMYRQTYRRYWACQAVCWFIQKLTLTLNFPGLMAHVRVGTIDQKLYYCIYFKYCIVKCVFVVQIYAFCLYTENYSIFVKYKLLYLKLHTQYI